MVKKINQLFIDYPELKILEPWLRKILSSKIRHPIKSAYKRYTLRKSKYFDKAVGIIRTGGTSDRQIVWAWRYIDHYYWGSALFEYLNKCFSKLSIQPRFKKLINNLKNREQFWATISEIEFNAYFAGRYKLELEPKIGTKFLDSKIRFGKRHTYFEVFTPELAKELKERDVVLALRPRAKGKFLDKLDRQLLAIKNKIRSPLVLVINASYSEFDELDIESVLLGEPIINIVSDKKTGKTEVFESREKNSLVEARPGASCISAILFYRRHIRPWGIEFRKNLSINEKADCPLTAKEFKALSRFDLRKI